MTTTSTDTTPTAGATQVVLHTTEGAITLELYPDKAPVTVGNFVKLAKEGFYDGTKFHRVIPNFMIQGGDPLTKDDSQVARWGTGGPGYTIDDEFTNGLSNVRGMVAMANTGQPHSSGSQFFINVVDNLFLDGNYSIFGKVVKGMEVVDAIRQAPTGVNDRPNKPVAITKVEVR